MTAPASHQYIASFALDESSLPRKTLALEHEREVAMADLVQWNHFAVKGAQGPYHVTLGVAENRIALTAASDRLDAPALIVLPLAPFRSVIRDYFLICESYFEALKSGNMPRTEAIDMSRRGLHNEGAELLTALLADKVELDGETARRLFTLICVLHLK